MVKPSGQDLGIISEMIKKEKVKTVIDRVFNLDELPDAHTYCESKRNLGKTIILVQQPDIKEETKQKEIG